MPLEYLSGNELLKYPFKDTSIMYSQNSILLPNDVFADLIFTFKRADIKFARLTGVGRFDNVAALMVMLSDKDGNDLDWDYYEIDLDSVIEHELIPFDLPHCTLRVVPGIGFTNFFSSLENPAIEEYEAFFDDSALNLYVPRVKQVAFYNEDELEAVIEGDEVTSTDLLLQAGSNIDFINLKSSLGISVIPGAGTGLYNPCDNDLVIKTINGLAGDVVYKNFSLLTDGCYITSRGNGVVPDFGMQLSNICTPKCGNDQMSAFAHYLNRVKDGMAALANHASTIYSDLADYIENYKTTILPTLTAPFIKSAITSFNDGYNHTHRSIIVAFFNRSDTGAIPISVNVTGGTFVKAFYRQGETTTQLELATYSGMLDCLKTSRFEITVKGSGSVIITASAGDTSYYKEYT